MPQYYDKSPYRIYCVVYLQDVQHNVKTYIAPKSKEPLELSSISMGSFSIFAFIL